MSGNIPLTTKLAPELPEDLSNDEYEDFIRRKVEAAREDMRAGRGRSHAEVEADSATRRGLLVRKTTDPRA